MANVSVPRADFSLDPGFLRKFEGQQPKWGPLGYVTYKRTYAAELPGGGTEEYWQTCKRVIEGQWQILKGHCLRQGLPWDDDFAQKGAQESFQRMWDFKWLPPGRGLSKMGTEIMFKIGGACLQNCGFASTQEIGYKRKNAFSEPFVWLMDMLMLGVGVGFDTLGAKTLSLTVPKTRAPFVVEDSRQGWLDLLRAVLESFVARNNAPFPDPVDYSQVRPKGSAIKGFGGTASGPESLVLLVAKLFKVCERASSRGGPILSEDIVDICNSIGECVVSGGVRRSSEIAFSDPTDLGFLGIKNYDSNPEATRQLGIPGFSGVHDRWARWASNNSVVVDSRTDFDVPARLTAKNGEPGYAFLENARTHRRFKDPVDDSDSGAMGFNPCGEQPLHNYELCCLVELFPANCTDLEDFERSAKFAYLYAKTVTLVPTHHARTNAIMTKNRRIGCSQAGIIDSINIIGIQEHLRWCDQTYEYLRVLDDKYSDWLGVSKSLRRTSNKPSGTISKLVGAREGIHESKSEYELQAIRINDNSPIVPRLVAAGYRVEPAVNERNTVVAYFPMHYPGWQPRSMWEQLELAAQIQYWWADNAVSVTIDFDKETEGPQIQRALEYYCTRLKGVSFLPRNDHGYVQAPKTPITKQQYEAYKAELKPLDLSNLESSTRDQEEKYCDGGVCEVPTKAA